MGNRSSITGRREKEGRVRHTTDTLEKSPKSPLIEGGARGLGQRPGAETPAPSRAATSCLLGVEMAWESLAGLSVPGTQAPPSRAQLLTPRRQGGSEGPPPSLSASLTGLKCTDHRAMFPNTTLL